MIGIDTHIAHWFHEHLTLSLIAVFLAMSDPGSKEWVTGITVTSAVYLAWKRHWYALLALGLAVPGGMLLNQEMKDWIHRPRPFQASPYIEMGGYSFPSGHTMAATLIYGLLAGFSLHLFKELRWRVLSIGTAATLVLAVGFSRVALGAHYLTDVLGAMATGAAWLRICSLTVQAVRRAFQRSRVEIAVTAQEARLTDSEPS